MPFYFGTHYIALHMLEGFLPREEIKLCRAPNGSRYRFDALMKGEIDATTLTEPYITLAEKKGCRIICSAFFHGTEVASDRVDAETYAAFNRAVREAVRRINANKSAYMHYFIDYHGKSDPEIAHAQGRGPAREPPRRLRSGADPGRRDAAHLRLAQELGHAGGDRVAAAARQHGRAALRASGGGVGLPRVRARSFLRLMLRSTRAACVSKHEAATPSFEYGRCAPSAG